MSELSLSGSSSANFLSRSQLLLGVGAFGIGLAIGCISWGRNEQIWQLSILIFLPLCWGMAGSRVRAWALSFGYFLAGTRGLPTGAIAFFGENSPAWAGIALWLGACLALSVPYYIFWSRDVLRRAFGFMAAVLVTALPPLGIIGWVSPLSLAGVLFPNGAWLGLSCCLILFFFLIRRNYYALGLFLILAITANFIAKDSVRSAPLEWEGRDTYFSGVWNGGANQAAQLLSSIERAKWLVTEIELIPPGVTVVLPETLLGRWDGLTEVILKDAEISLKERDSRVLVGAELANGEGGYKNALIVLGANENEQRLAVQSMPVPISMWKPWAIDGADADLLGRGNTIKVGPYQVGSSICYEQLVLFSMLRLMLDKPDVIAAVSNVWWARESNIPIIQQQSIGALSRLFNVPVISAKNT